MSEFKKNALIFKAFCDESRLRILEQLKSGERCACSLLEKLPISQSTLSHHMKILVESGIVVARKEGKWTHYRLSEEGSQKAMNKLSDIINIEDDKYVKCNCNK